LCLISSEALQVVSLHLQGLWRPKGCTLFLTILRVLFLCKFFQLLVCGISDMQTSCCGIRYYREYLGSTRAHCSCPGRDERDLRTTFKYTK